MISDDILEIEDLETYPLQNAEAHNTQKYELMQTSHLSILRRSAFFFLGIKCLKRSVDLSKDIIKIVFAFGKDVFKEIYISFIVLHMYVVEKF